MLIQIKEDTRKTIWWPSINLETWLEISWSQDHKLNMSFYNFFDILERGKGWPHLWTIYRMMNSVQRENIHLIWNFAAEKQFWNKALMLISNKRLMCSAPGTSNSFFWRLILLLLIELLERQLFVWLIMVDKTYSGRI